MQERVPRMRRHEVLCARWLYYFDHFIEVEAMTGGEQVLYLIQQDENPVIIDALIKYEVNYSAFFKLDAVLDSELIA